VLTKKRKKPHSPGCIPLSRPSSFRTRAALFVSLLTSMAALGLGACGLSYSSYPRIPGPAESQFPLGLSEISYPTTINLYPIQSASNPRLVVMVTAVGSQQVSLPLVFDTGSAGVTLNALDLFPPSMVNSTGFIFPDNQTSMTYEGITVEKKQEGIKSYAGAHGTTQHGNVGYAQVSFGDANGVVTTGVMPVFLFYSVTDTQGGGPISSSTEAGLYEGLFGVDTEADPVEIPNSDASDAEIPPCLPTAILPCSTVSAFKYLYFGNGVKAGFLLSPATLQSCDISTRGDCLPQGILTIGVTSLLESVFSIVSLSCPPVDYNGPEFINGYLVCQKGILNSIVAISGPAIGTSNSMVLFDSGTPNMILYNPPGNPFPLSVPSGTSVLVTLPSAFTYSYDVVANTDTSTSVQSNANNDQTHIGVAYFTTNSFFIDFTSNTEGWMKQ
jgi:hypothetical protein